jgi:hypothetical protein
VSDPIYPVLARSLRVAKGEHQDDHGHAREPSGAKSQRTRYDGTRGGVGDHLTEHRVWGVFSYEGSTSAMRR